MQGSIEHPLTVSPDQQGSYFMSEFLSDLLSDFLNSSFVNQLSSFIDQSFAQSSDIKYLLLSLVIAMLFLFMLFFFRSKEQPDDEFIHIPVTKYPDNPETDNLDTNISGTDTVINNNSSDGVSNTDVKHLKTRPKDKNILESAFQPEWDVHNTMAEIQTDEINSPLISDETSDPLNSMEEIRKVNQSTLDQRISAFQELNTDIQITDEQWLQEFENIRNNEKLDVFIDEFEQLLSEINSRTKNMEESPENLDNLIQFQSSISFIKVLSEMVQAQRLNHFSYTVAEFLDGLIEGQIRTSSDIGRRLSKVVKFRLITDSWGFDGQAISPGVKINFKIAEFFRILLKGFCPQRAETLS